VPFDRGNGWQMITANPPNQNLPTSNYIRPNSRRLDLGFVENGKIQTLYDLKFPGDRPLAERDPERLKDYEDIPAKNGAAFDEINVSERCPDCDDDEKNKQVLEQLLEGLTAIIILLIIKKVPVPEGEPEPGFSPGTPSVA
jgi:rubredoxin